MNQNKIMRFVYWALSSFFMFAAAVMAISLIKPGPTESQVMQWMHGMMAAMHSSLMGASMENAENYMFLLSTSAGLSVIMIILGIVTGVTLRMWRKS